MEHTPTILAELDNYLRENNLTLAEFAECSGVHQRTLNNWILKHRPVAIHQLDRMTLAMGLPEGFFLRTIHRSLHHRTFPGLAAN